MGVVEPQDTAEWHHTRAVSELDVIKERITPDTMPSVANLEIAIHSAEEMHRSLWDLKIHIMKAKRNTNDG